MKVLDLTRVIFELQCAWHCLEHMRLLHCLCVRFIRKVYAQIIQQTHVYTQGSSLEHSGTKVTLPLKKSEYNQYANLTILCSYILEIYTMYTDQSSQQLWVTVYKFSISSKETFRGCSSVSCYFFYFLFFLHSNTSEIFQSLFFL